jgi:hypothetical protein
LRENGFVVKGRSLGFDETGFLDVELQRRIETCVAWTLRDGD